MAAPIVPVGFVVSPCLGGSDVWPPPTQRVATLCKGLTGGVLRGVGEGFPVLLTFGNGQGANGGQNPNWYVRCGGRWLRLRPLAHRSMSLFGAVTKSGRIKTFSHGGFWAPDPHAFLANRVAVRQFFASGPPSGIVRRYPPRESGAFKFLTLFSLHCFGLCSHLIANCEYV